MLGVGGTEGNTRAEPTDRDCPARHHQILHFQSVVQHRPHRGEEAGDHRRREHPLHHDHGRRAWEREDEAPQDCTAHRAEHQERPPPEPVGHPSDNWIQDKFSDAPKRCVAGEKRSCELAVAICDAADEHGPALVEKLPPCHDHEHQRPNHPDS